MKILIIASQFNLSFQEFRSKYQDHLIVQPHCQGNGSSMRMYKGSNEELTHPMPIKCLRTEKNHHNIDNALSLFTHQFHLARDQKDILSAYNNKPR